MSHYYIGLMSGTSADGIDLALVDFSSNQIKLVASDYQPYTTDVQEQITSLYNTGINEIDRLGELDIQLAHLFAKAINSFINKLNLTANDIVAIGNHGQTVRHRPSSPYPFTLQISCNQTLAVHTGIKVIGDFRRKDMALGGQGAPLVPAFHNALFSARDSDTVVVNIGGIANITFLPHAKTQQITGYDTGPGNALMDEWFQQHHSGKAYDENGDWARSGHCETELLVSMLEEPYFKQRGPKSTGREQFHLSWLKKKIANSTASPENIQATLAHLTAQSLANEIKQCCNQGKVYLAGGGYRNTYLVELIKDKLPNHQVSITNQLDIDPDSLEAQAFAWFAFAYEKKLFSNIPEVTGASSQTVLGNCFLP